MTEPTAVQIVPAEVATRANDLCVTALGLTVATQTDYEHGADLLRAIKGQLGTYEAGRTKLVKPLNEHVKMINAQAKMVMGPLEAADRYLREQMTAFTLEQRRVAEAEAARVKAEADAAALELAAKMENVGADSIAEGIVEHALTQEAAPIKTAPTHTAFGTTAGYRERWVYELVDDALVPREYLCVDDVAVNRAVKGGAREIAGLRIFDAGSIAVRR
jgi:hypothetical protein